MERESILGWVKSRREAFLGRVVVFFTDPIIGDDPRRPGVQYPRSKWNPERKPGDFVRRKRHLRLLKRETVPCPDNEPPSAS